MGAYEVAFVPKVAKSNPLADSEIQGVQWRP
jgi:hypothetical protein